MRMRLATWAALACLGLVAGCQSSNPCGNGGLFNGGLMSRLRLRPRCPAVCCEGPALGMPVDAMPVSTGFPGGLNGHVGLPGGDLPLAGDCPTCVGNGGPVLPPVETTLPPSGPPLPGYPGLPPAATVPGVPMPPPGASNLPPSGVLPTPAPIGGAPPALAPVPNGGLARPVPADPSSRSLVR